MLYLKRFKTGFLETQQCNYYKYSKVSIDSLTEGIEITKTNLLDTGRKLNLHKTFKRRPGRRLNLLCRFDLRPVSRKKMHENFITAVYNATKNVGV